MHEMQTIVTDDRGVCLSICHAAQLGYAVQKQLNGSRSYFGWKLLGACGTVFDESPDPPHSEGELGKILPIVDPLHMSRFPEARDSKFSVLGSETKTMQK